MRLDKNFYSHQYIKTVLLISWVLCISVIPLNGWSSSNVKKATLKDVLIKEDNQTRKARPEEIPEALTIDRLNQQGEITSVLAKRNMDLYVGDVIQTNSTAIAVIAFPGNGKIILAPDTHVEIREKSLFIRFGKTFFNMKEYFRWETDYVAGGNIETKYEVTVDAENTVSVRVTEGVVLLEPISGNQWEPRKINAQEKATIREASPPQISQMQQGELDEIIRQRNQIEQLISTSPPGASSGIPSGISDKIRLGIIFPDLMSEYWADIKKGIEDESTKFDVEMFTAAPSRPYDVMQQLNILDAVIAQKVDGIAIAPADPEALIPAINKAREAGIPVVLFDLPINFENFYGEIHAFMTFDNFQIGKQAAEFIRERLGNSGGGQVAIVEGYPGVLVSEERKHGFLSIIEETQSLTVVAMYPGEWQFEKALEITENILLAYPEIKAIYACNDSMALGAVQAVEGMGRDNIIVVGTDGSSEAIQAIQEGKLAATIALKPDEMGAITLRRLVEIIQNKEAPPDGDFRIYVPTEFMTKDTIR